MLALDNIVSLSSVPSFFNHYQVAQHTHLVKVSGIHLAAETGLSHEPATGPAATWLGPRF